MIEDDFYKPASYLTADLLPWPQSHAHASLRAFLTMQVLHQMKTVEPGETTQPVSPMLTPDPNQ
jgi:hypothetical protein